MEQYWGIDLGGTKIECAVITYRKEASVKNQFEVLHRERVPTESAKGYEHVINQVKTLVSRVETQMGYRPSRLGIGTPGAIEPKTALMKNSNSVCLNGKPFERDLERELGIELKMVNDANCFAMAETHLGVVQDLGEKFNNVFGVIMGTGVGGGVIINGNALYGRHGIGGEWGHNLLESGGEMCYCGRVGCVETVIAGPWLERYYAKIAGEKKTLKEVVERHRSGVDSKATETIHRLTSMFGKGIAQVINILDPEVVVIGGGVGNIDEIYTEGVDEVKKYVFNPQLKTKFLKPKLGDSAGVFGAALLWAEE